VYGSVSICRQTLDCRNLFGPNFTARKIIFYLILFSGADLIKDRNPDDTLLQRADTFEFPHQAQLYHWINQGVCGNRSRGRDSGQSNPYANNKKENARG
jgi:hypothetical protein